LVDLAEKRLSPARPVLAKRPQVNVASNKARQEAEPRTSRVRLRRVRTTDAIGGGSAAPAGTFGSAADAKPARDGEQQNATQPEDREVEVVGEPGTKARIRTQIIKGEQLTQQHVGRLVTEGRDGYNIMGKILDLTPVITDQAGSWLVTVHWAALPGQQPRVDRRRIRFSDDVELVELLADEDGEG
jgi:hypothetical protein